MSKINYREVKQKLEEVLAQMQDQDTDLEKAIGLHAEGKKLVSMLEEYLTGVEEKIKTIKKTD